MAAESEDRFAAYVEVLSAALGHADRTGPFQDYCLGLLMPVERKSVEPLAAITAPGRIAAQHQSLLHFKKEVGLGHYEGRGWRGFHHHATLRIAAYDFLISERGALPPQDGSQPADSSRLSFSAWTTRPCHRSVRSGT